MFGANLYMTDCSEWIRPLGGSDGMGTYALLLEFWKEGNPGKDNGQGKWDLYTPDLPQRPIGT